ncbi:aldolase/citrate lyase family protein [soil metagenome]
MRENKLRTKLENGDAVVNGWLQIPSSVAAEAMAHQGFDSLTLDLQHGPLHYDAALPMLQAISTTDTTPLARVPWNEPGIIMKMLDAGCYGIICPMVNSRAECEAFVQACRYPPQGYRSFGPTRAKFYAGADYAPNANATVLTFAMIETKAALDNLDDILSVPGLDAIYVGPADLSQSLGGPPGADFEDGPVPEALDKIIEAAKQHGVKAGIHNA